MQRFQHHAFSARDRMSLIYKTVFRLVLLLLFGMLVVPWMLCAAPIGLFLSVASDQKAKEVQKMSVKATWKVMPTEVLKSCLTSFVYLVWHWTKSASHCSFLIAKSASHCSFLIEASPDPLWHSGVARPARRLHCCHGIYVWGAFRPRLGLFCPAWGHLCHPDFRRRWAL